MVFAFGLTLFREHIVDIVGICTEE